MLGFFQLGLTAPLTDRVAWSVEAMVFGYPGVWQVSDVGFPAPAAAFSASMGPQFSFGERPHTGFFFNPKVTANVTPGVFGPTGQTVGHDELLGLDVGYQFRTTDLYVALVLGASVGYGTLADDIWAGPYFAIGNRSRGVNQLVVALNLHLLRFGFRF